MPIQLEDRLDTAEIDGAEIHADLAKPVEWTFEGDAASWRALHERLRQRAPHDAEPISFLD